jgi:pyruvate dehydrogenase E2 component (dihydrolipoamide acetyltransferase)
MEIPSPAAGVLKELKVKLGDKVNMGDLVAMLEGAAPRRLPCATAAAAAPAPAVAAVAAPAPVAAAPACRAPARHACAGLHASPRCASSRASWACRWPKSSTKGRITQDDVQAFTKP